MRTAISLITAAALIAHFWLGCCAHHGHSHGDHTTAQLTAGADHDHDAADHNSPADESDSDHDGCQEPSCVFVAAGKLVLTKDVTPLATAVVSTDSIAPLELRLAPTRRIETDTGQHVPLRLHLYLQILLI
jgi:hypothetical protein